jgi:hypothetical protein
MEAMNRLLDYRVSRWLVVLVVAAAFVVTVWVQRPRTEVVAKTGPQGGVIDLEHPWVSYGAILNTTTKRHGYVPNPYGLVLAGLELGVLVALLMPRGGSSND